MRTTDATGEGGGGRSVTITRRRLLASCATILSGLLGARLLSAWAPPLGGVARGASVPAALPASAGAGYEPAKHEWAFACDASLCIGCGLCVAACKEENHVPRDPEYNRTWVERHVVATDGAVFVDSPAGGIDGFPPESTAPGAAGAIVRSSYFVPRLCMQCDNPPCVSVCPVSATYKTDDGVVLVDQERCIGCGYCVVACPYGARYIVPSGELLPNGNAGVADKCTWCYHRISRGKVPACVEVCPMSARIFGDLNDPESRVNDVLKQHGVQVLKADLGTKPRVYYLGLEAEVI